MKSHLKNIHHKKVPALEDSHLIPEEDVVESSFPVEKSVDGINSPVISGRTIQYLTSIAFFLLVIVSSIGIFLLSNKI